MNEGDIMLQRCGLICRAAVIAGLCFRTAQCDGWQFERQTVHDRTGWSTECCVADIDGDGKMDLFCARTGVNRWYKNLGGDRPQWQESGDVVGGDWMGWWHGDFDGDGDIDLVGSSKGTAKTHAWFENTNGSGSAWAQHNIFTPGDRSDNMRTYDFDGDGRDDIVANLYNGSAVYYIQAGEWSPHKIGGGSTGLNLYDIDNDGDMDVLVNNQWLENPGNPSQQSWPSHRIDAGYSDTKIAAGDFSGDGRADVVLAGEPDGNGMYWYEAPEDPNSDNWPKHTLQASYRGVHSLQVADFDGDGDADIFAAEMHVRGEHRVAIFENADGAGGAWTEHIIDNGGTHNAALADVNGDGTIDIVGKNYDGANPLYVWYNTLDIATDARTTRGRTAVASATRPRQEAPAVFSILGRRLGCEHGDEAGQVLVDRYGQVGQAETRIPVQRQHRSH